MQTLSLTPLFRSTVGFDRFNDLFESLMDNDDGSSSYPPYNIEKRGEDRYGITMAVKSHLATSIIRQKTIKN